MKYPCFSYRSYSTLSIASSRSSLASDLHDVGTPAPSSPLPPPDVNKDTHPASSTPVPPEDQEKQRSHSPTPQPPPPSQTQAENEETGATSTSTALTNPPEISVQGAEDNEQGSVPNTTNESTAEQPSLSEAKAQVEASATNDIEGTKEREKEGEEDAFGDFQGAEGVSAAVTDTTLGEPSQNSATDGGASQAPSQVEGDKENLPEAEVTPHPSSLSANLTDTATNLQQTSPDTVTGIVV